jgi:hypothetical protein
LNPATAVIEPYKPSGTSFIYPNPFSESSVVYAQGFDFGIQKPQLKVYDLLGNIVYAQILNSDEEQLHVKLPAGGYSYIITQGKNSATGKMIVMPK